MAVILFCVGNGEIVDWIAALMKQWFSFLRLKNVAGFGWNNKHVDRAFRALDLNTGLFRDATPP